MSGDARVREARPADVDALVGLMSENYAESGYPFERSVAVDAFTRLLGDAGLGRVWVIEGAERPVGYAILTLGYSLEYGGRDAFVDDVFVRAERRRTGLGRAALAALLAEARRLGVRAVHLEVERGNPGARSLYEALGFRDNDRQLLSLQLGDGEV